jgi:hypothetical protein
LAAAHCANETLHRRNPGFPDLVFSVDVCSQFVHGLQGRTTGVGFFTGTLPPELNSSDSSAQREAWANWVIGHDNDIRARLLRGDEDTIVK